MNPLDDMENLKISLSALKTDQNQIVSLSPHKPDRGNIICLLCLFCTQYYITSMINPNNSYVAWGLYTHVGSGQSDI